MKRWIVSWGYDTGRIYYLFTDRALRSEECLMSDLGSGGQHHQYFHAWAISDVEHGRRENLSLNTNDQGFRAVSAAIEIYCDTLGHQDGKRSMSPLMGS